MILSESGKLLDDCGEFRKQEIQAVAKEDLRPDQYFLPPFTTTRAVPGPHYRYNNSL